ncbi:MAG: efflux RND transporter periplasmic adaptor subunit [Clostridium sp.]
MDKKNLNREWLLRMAERLMKKKKIVIPAALVFIAAAAFTLGRGGKGPEGKPEDMGRQMNVTAVSAEPPGTGSIELETAVTGTIEPSDVVYLYARAAGDVTSVLVKAGDTVEAGQLLAVIDTKQVESAENAMESARLSYESAQSTLSRQELLYAGGDISEQEYEQYQNQAESSRLAYESAKMSYENQVEYSNITAPVSGVIESCSIEAFDHVSSNEELCVISGEGAQTLKFKVTERIAGNLAAGDELRVEKDGETYSGSITEVSGMADASTGLFEVKGSINGADSVASGSVVKIYLVSDRAENVMTVPVDAVYFVGGVGNVYLYQDGTVHKQQVEVGIFDSSLAEIQSGLTESDLVISTWSSELYEGSTVKLKNEKTDEQPDRQQTESAGEPLDPMPEP